MDAGYGAPGGITCEAKALLIFLTQVFNDSKDKDGYATEQ